MIITRTWLEEYIKLKDITNKHLYATLNSIGLEVDRLVEYRVPAKIVFGHVVECEKHPDADKLSICKVDIGTSVRQIVCGATNVRVGIDVAVAIVGADMGNNFVIKPVKLRGVESEGMICSSTELGLPKLEDGIMEIDSSVGKFELGSELCKNPYFNDDLIEIELTANRGDCLSIRGVARDLSAALNLPLMDSLKETEQDRRIGIGRILSVSHNDNFDVNLSFRAIDLKTINIPLYIKLRLAQIEYSGKTDLDSLLYYSTYSNGVILRAYHFGLFSEKGSTKAKAIVEKNSDGFVSVFGKSLGSIIGVNQSEESQVTYDEGMVLIEASYISPEKVSKKMFETKIKSDDLFYRTSRGSEPDLKMGGSYFFKLLEENSESPLFGGSIDVESKKKLNIVSITQEEIESFIGTKIEKSKITQILKNLGFDIGKSQASSYVIHVPPFRHDIVNKQDIVEEIVRMIGIDNIPSKPIILKEKNRKSPDFDTYKKRKLYRYRIANLGFNESVHFVFNEKKVLEKYGFEYTDKKLELLNPIAGTLDTLRSTILINLLQSASFNAKNGSEAIKLFEIGSVFNSKREESVKVAMIFSGKTSSDSFTKKTQKFDFASVIDILSKVVGDVELHEHKSTHNIAHPYQNAKIVKNNQEIGEVFKVHPEVASEFDLDDTFLLEFDFNALDYELKIVKDYSKFQASFRDLSILSPKEMKYENIQSVIEEASHENVKRFYIVDRYEDDSLGENISLSVRFVLQSNEKTLEEEDITTSMQSILDALKEKLGLELR